MNFLPKELEDIIIDYKNQLEHIPIIEEFNNKIQNLKEKIKTLENENENDNMNMDNIDNIIKTFYNDNSDSDIDNTYDRIFDLVNERTKYKKLNNLTKIWLSSMLN